jgi:hypothetical protein
MGNETSNASMESSPNNAKSDPGPVTEDQEAVDAFRRGQLAKFFAHMEIRHRRRLISRLVMTFRISAEDADDCYATGLMALCEKADLQEISNPIGYVLTPNSRRHSSPNNAIP